jgi:hypothetical protein
MSFRGRVLPDKLQRRIRELRAEYSLRRTARSVGVAVNTVRKYDKSVLRSQAS